MWPELNFRDGIGFVGRCFRYLPFEEGVPRNLSKSVSVRIKGNVGAVTDILKEGDKVLVKVIDIDPQGRIRLSRKAALKDSEKSPPREV